MSESMLVTTAQLIVVGVAVFVAAFMQIVAGFGFALLSVPLMTLAIEPKVAVVDQLADRHFRHHVAGLQGPCPADRVLVQAMTIAVVHRDATWASGVHHRR